MTKQHPFGRYAVYSNDKWQAQFPNAVPAARYEDLPGAIEHADSVTYKMVVVDMTSESRGFVYTNWTKYQIERSIPGGFRDSLRQLWEGNDLPTFAVSSPYLFDDKATAERVAQRLAARYPETMTTPRLPAKPITYSVVPVVAVPQGWELTLEHGYRTYVKTFSSGRVATVREFDHLRNVGGYVRDERNGPQQTPKLFVWQSDDYPDIQFASIEAACAFADKRNGDPRTVDSKPITPKGWESVEA